MIRSESRLIVGCVLAVVAPAAVLHFAAGAERHAAGLTAAPFAWPRVLVAHLALTIPLGLIVAARLRGASAVNEVAPALWPLVGAGLIGLAVVVGPVIGDTLAGGEFGTAPLLALRTLCALVLVLPWCVWVTEPPLVRPGAAVALGLALAVVPCGLYAEAVVEARTANAEELIATGRTVRGERVLAGLCELGSDRPVAGKPPAEVRRRLRAEITRLERTAGHLLSPSASPIARFGRVEVLLQLDRLDEAAELLRPLAERSTTATLLLAAVDRDRERWAESDAGYETALTRLLPVAETNAGARANCRMAFEGLAHNARMDRRPADAEAALRRGRESLPADAAHFWFLLGRHYHDGGRPALAIEHLEEAVRLDPAKYREPADKILRQIRTHTPACAPWRTP